MDVLADLIKKDVVSDEVWKRFITQVSGRSPVFRRYNDRPTNMNSTMNS